MNILLNGCTGKMGKEVIEQVKSDKNLSIVAGFALEKSSMDFPIFQDVKDISVVPDVIIDFSSPDATMALLPYAKEKNIPMVIATTGFSKEQLDIIQKTSSVLPIFMSSNMSYEVNVMADTVSRLSTLLSGSDIEIVETHHNQKKDAPSRNSLIFSR